MSDSKAEKLDWRRTLVWHENSLPHSRPKITKGGVWVKALCRFDTVVEISDLVINDSANALPQVAAARGSRFDTEVEISSLVINELSANAG